MCPKYSGFFCRESSAQTPVTCNEVMDLQVDYWTTGGKKEISKVNKAFVDTLIIKRNEVFEKIKVVCRIVNENC